jgi:hypothetical protein
MPINGFSVNVVNGCFVLSEGEGKYGDIELLM